MTYDPTNWHFWQRADRRLEDKSLLDREVKHKSLRHLIVNTAKLEECSSWPKHNFSCVISWNFTVSRPKAPRRAQRVLILAAYGVWSKSTLMSASATESHRRLVMNRHSVYLYIRLRFVFRLTSTVFELLCSSLNQYTSQVTDMNSTSVTGSETWMNMTRSTSSNLYRSWSRSCLMAVVLNLSYIAPKLVLSWKNN